LREGRGKKGSTKWEKKSTEVLCRGEIYYLAVNGG